MTNNQQLQVSGANNTSPTMPPAPVGRGKKPIPTMLLGLLFMSLWFILEMVDIAASEALYTHDRVTSFTPEWNLLLQIPRILTGAGPAMPVQEAKGAIVAWILATCSLACIVGYDLARDAVKHANPKLEKAFGGGLIFFAVVDFWANFQYGPGGSGFWEQLLFSIAVTFAGFFFGLPGFRLLEHGVKTWKHGY